MYGRYSKVLRGAILVGLLGCDTVAATLYYEGPNGEQSSFDLTRSDFDLGDNEFPNYPLISVANHATSFRIVSGATALFCQQKFYGGLCFELTGDDQTWSLGPVTAPASVELYKNEWLSSINSMIYTSTWPDCADTTGVSNHTEGIAHSDSHLFVSTVDKVFRLPLGADLEDESNTLHDAVVTMPGSNGHNHVGDIDVFSNYVFVPLEVWPPDTNAPPARLTVLDHDLNLAFVNDFPKAVQTQAGFVAVNPVNGLVYSTDNPSVLHVYEMQPHGQPLRHLYDVTLDYPPPSLGNGGAFSPSGHFYTATGDNNGYMHVSTYAIKGRNGTRKARTVPVPVSTYVQGIDVFDVDSVSGEHPGWQGQVHVAIGHWGVTDWTIWHYNVDAPESL